MRVLIACKRGNSSVRDKWGHCLCDACKKHRYEVSRNSNRQAYQKEWQQKNKEKVGQYTKKWIDNNKEKRNGIVDAWRKSNPELVKEMNNRAGRKWSQNNKAKRNAIDMKRKASLLSRTPKWANLEAIKEFYVEAHRLTRLTGVIHEVDHIIPLQGKYISGLHVSGNLQILTRSENRSKGNKI